jgi:putative ABC transport system permease protein
MLIAFRNIIRHKGSFFINLTGLSTGLACTFLIYLWVTDELKFDKFHKNDSQLYQILEKSTENASVIVHEGTQGPLAEAMKKDMPEVISAVPVMSLEKNGMKISVRIDDKVIKAPGIFTHKEFFEMFSFPVMLGNPDNIMSSKEAMVLSESLAISLFGSPDSAIGKNVSWEIMGKQQTSKITGVFAPLPKNNSLNFDFVANWDILYDNFQNFQKWSNTGPNTYLLLKKGTDVAQFNSKIEKFINKYLGDNKFTLFVRPYSNGYLYGKYENGIQSGGRIEYVRLFSIVAIFILVIACINFMNLSTAKASHRLKEVGIKKAIGSTKSALVLQFLSEAVFMVFFSMITAIFMVTLVMPAFNNITGKHLSISTDPKIITLALLITFITGIFAGSYPAFYMSGLKAVSLFKGKLKKSVPEMLARKGLVVFQFALSFILIVGVMVIVKQVSFVQSKNIGYDKSNIIHFDKEGGLNGNSAESFLAEVKNIPGVMNASSVQQNVMQKGNGSSTYGINWAGKSSDALIDIAVRAVNYDLIETLGIQLVDGRSFSDAYRAGDQGLIFNETAIKLMGLKKPVGTKINMWGEDRTIIGVVKDFHISSLHEMISPLVFYFDSQKASTFMVKIEPGKERETIGKVKDLYKKFNPGYLFEYRFLDELYQAQYISEQRVSVISKYFAALGIIISCLGLFGLAAYNAAVRKKEISIRKALGASTGNVIGILSKDYAVLIIISMVIGFPLSWVAMNAWLDGFAYRVNIGAYIFIVAGMSMIILALITVSYQSLRAALRSPVKNLRTE